MLKHCLKVQHIKNARENALKNYFSNISNFGQISKFKRDIPPKKNSIERIQRSYAHEKVRTDELTYGLTIGRDKNNIPSATATRCIGHNNNY